MSSKRIIVALDFNTPAMALGLASELDPKHCRLKVGKELFTRGGSHMVEQLHARGFEIFLDLKFHDIPNTVAKAVQAAADLGIWMVNVHAFGGARMLAAAKEAICQHAHPPKLIAVTVLTSMDADELRAIGVEASPAEQVMRLAKLARQAGMDGVVCSAQEAAALKAQLGNDFIAVTPGIRPAGSNPDDQTRIMTPREALLDGSDYLVIGRPITRARNPLLALEQINQEISGISR